MLTCPGAQTEASCAVLSCGGGSRARAARGLLLCSEHAFKSRRQRGPELCGTQLGPQQQARQALAWPGRKGKEAPRAEGGAGSLQEQGWSQESKARLELGLEERVKDKQELLYAEGLQQEQEGFGGTQGCSSV